MFFVGWLARLKMIPWFPWKSPDSRPTAWWCRRSSGLPCGGLPVCVPANQFLVAIQDTCWKPMRREVPAITVQSDLQTSGDFCGFFAGLGLQEIREGWVLRLLGPLCWNRNWALHATNVHEDNHQLFIPGHKNLRQKQISWVWKLLVVRCKITCSKNTKWRLQQTRTNWRHHSQICGDDKMLSSKHNCRWQRSKDSANHLSILALWFAVKDIPCSLALNNQPHDVIFAAWILNYFYIILERQLCW